MKLYEITSEYLGLLENTFDDETGEINETSLSLLGEIKTEMKEKGIAIASYIKNIEAEKKAIEEAKNAMAIREKNLDKKASYLTNYLQYNMERCGINEISCPYFIIKIKKCPLSVDVEDENIIPDEYKKTKQVISLDKIKIKESILNGEDVAGASLKQNTRLEIR